MDVLRFTTVGAVGFLCCGIAIGVMGMATSIRTIPLWGRVLVACGAITLWAFCIVAIVVANPVAGGGG
jgi:hypothetical protein